KGLSFLIGILALIYLCFFIYKKRAHARSTNTRITILERCALDQRTTISLIRIDHREIIVAAQQNALALEMLPNDSDNAHLVNNDRSHKEPVNGVDKVAFAQTM